MEMDITEMAREDMIGMKGMDMVVGDVMAMEGGTMDLDRGMGGIIGTVEILEMDHEMLDKLDHLMLIYRRDLEAHLLDRGHRTVITAHTIPLMLLPHLSAGLHQRLHLLNLLLQGT